MAKILIVSDDSTLKNYIQNHLLEGNHTLILSRNTTEALSMLIEKTVKVKTRAMIPESDHPCDFSEHERRCGIELYPVDLVISDRLVNGISGAEFLEKVRSNLRNMKTLLVDADILQMASGSATLEIRHADDHHFISMLRIALRQY